jgi:hypothetical protein
LFLKVSNGYSLGEDMKKIFLLLFAAFVTLQPLAWGAARDNSQTAVYFCSGGTTGGGSFSLDSLDQTGDGDTDITDGTPNEYDLVASDVAFALTGVGNVEIFIYDATGTFAELAPAFVRPNDYDTSGVWVNSKLITYDIANGEQKLVRYGVWYAGENLFDGGQVYIKWVSGNTRPEVFQYAGDTLDADNDTYVLLGYAQADCTSGDPCVIDVGESTLARRDAFSYINTDIGKPLFTLGGAGLQGTTPQAEAGDHNEMLGVFIGADGSDAGYGFATITGDYVLYKVPTARVVVPTP